MVLTLSQRVDHPRVRQVQIACQGISKCESPGPRPPCSEGEVCFDGLLPFLISYGNRSHLFWNSNLCSMVFQRTTVFPNLWSQTQSYCLAPPRGILPSPTFSSKHFLLA